MGYLYLPPAEDDDLLIPAKSTYSKSTCARVTSNFIDPMIGSWNPSGRKNGTRSMKKSDFVGIVRYGVNLKAYCGKCSIGPVGVFMQIAPSEEAALSAGGRAACGIQNRRQMLLLLENNRRLAA